MYQTSPSIFLLKILFTISSLFPPSHPSSHNDPPSYFIKLTHFLKPFLTSPFFPLASRFLRLSLLLLLRRRAALCAVRATFQHSHRLARAQQEANLILRSSNLNNDADLRDDDETPQPSSGPHNIPFVVIFQFLFFSLRFLLPSRDTRLRPNQVAMKEEKFELTGGDFVVVGFVDD